MNKIVTDIFFSLYHCTSCHEIWCQYLILFRSIQDVFFACSLMNSRSLAVRMMTQFSFGTSWTVHPQRAHHNSRTCSNSTLAPQHARTLTSQSNYGQWWLFHIPTTRVICRCIWNIFILSHKLVPDIKSRIAQELPEWDSWIQMWFYISHFESLQVKITDFEIWKKYWSTI